MLEEQIYKVFPEPVISDPVEPDRSRIVLTNEQRRAAEGFSGEAVALGVFLGGTLVTAIALLVAVYVLGISGSYIDDNRTPYVVIFGVSTVAGTVFASMKIKKRNLARKEQEVRKARERDYEALKKAKESEYQRKLEQNEREADQRTKRLNTIFDASLKTRAELAQRLTKSESLLSRAEVDYGENAYSPFWDAVQETANHLAAFSRGAADLSKNADEYYSLLKNRRHNFPVFPVHLDALPDPLPVTRDFRRIVRKGQTNFEFANIWEHRRTRDVLIAGFQTLGDAVNNLGGVIEESLSNLERATSSDVAELVQAQITSRGALLDHMKEDTQIAREQSRMLDNIQRHRTP